MVVEGWYWHSTAITPLAYWSLIAATAILLALAAALNAVILRKAGHSAWWAVLVLFPFLYVIGVWIFAWSRWPHAQGTPTILGPPPTVV